MKAAALAATVAALSLYVCAFVCMCARVRVCIVCVCVRDVYMHVWVRVRT